MEKAAGRLMTEKVGEVTVVSFMDSQIRNQTLADRIGAELVALATNTYKARIVLNFERVQYLSSAVLGKLVAANKRVLEGKGKMVLCAILPVIREVFEITRLDRVFEIYDDVSGALRSMETL